MSAEDIGRAFRNASGILVIAGSMCSIENNFQGRWAAALVDTVYDSLYGNDCAGCVIHFAEHQRCRVYASGSIGDPGNEIIFLRLPTSEIVLRRKMKLAQFGPSNRDKPLCYLY